MTRVVFALAAAALLAATAPAAVTQEAATPVRNRAPLAASAFTPLPLGAVTPAGWLRRQLEIQAAGLTGHLDEFWPDVGPSSGWLGGDGESWERGPYFLDGLLPLAYLLGDERLIAKTKPWIEWTLTHQTDSGWIGPARNRDWWPNMVMLKVLAQYQEATGDPRVVPLMRRYFAHHAREAAARPLHQWASYRWADELLTVLWLYNRTGDAMLLDLARTLKAQGTDWRAHFERFEFPDQTSSEQLGLGPGLKELPDRAMRAHVVNNAMALKTSIVWSLVSNDAGDRAALYHAIDVLDRHHGQPNGMFSGDEHYSGRDPSQGTELCAVVESAFSLEHAVAVTGDAALADRLERIAYNAMPATFSGDMWAHQYDQQANQVLCSLHRRAWVSNGPEANIFGLEPNFGCCTSNMHQGWPKVAAHTWMATADEGLAAVVHAPSTARAVVRGGVEARVESRTDYPFDGVVEIAVTPSRRARFPLHVRIPGWAAGASVTVNGEARPGVVPGTFHVVDREWSPGDRVRLSFPMEVRTSRWFRNSVAVERGPLVYALAVGEDWRKLTTGMRRPAPPPAADYEVHPTTPWNYALVMEGDAPAGAEVRTREVGGLPFSAGGAPVSIRVRARRLPSWTLVNGSAGPLPESPVHASAPDETVTLIPYGAAKLRVTALPWTR